MWWCFLLQLIILHVQVTLGVERLTFVCLCFMFSLYAVGCVLGMANDRLRALEDVEKEIALVLQSAGLCKT